VPYGYYNRHPITVPFTQLLTQTNATALQVGFVDTSGFNGSLFAFRTESTAGTSGNTDILGDNGRGEGNTIVSNSRHRVENGGVQIGYKYDQADMGFIADASWLGNLAAVDYVASNLDSYREAVAGYSIDLMGHYMGFDGEAQYTTSSGEFAMSDVCVKCNSLDAHDFAERDGAKPAAWLIGIGYNFDMAAHKSRVGINYQKSKDSVDVGLAGIPSERWQADWTVNLWKNTDITFEYIHDQDYEEDDGGTGEDSGTGLIRLATRFA